MTDTEFEMGLTGDPERTADGSRLCYLVSEGLSARAKERRAEGRPDLAGRLEWVASKLLAKGRPTKNALRKISSDISIVKQRLVDVPEDPHGITLTPPTKPIAKTANLDAFLAPDGKTVQILRSGKLMIQIKMKDLEEYGRLIAKVRGLSALREMVPLFGELEPPKR